MKRIAILVIAALNQPVYRHYIASYWTDLVRHTEAHLPHVDVYLLIEHGRDLRPFAHIADHVIEDPTGDLEPLLPRHLHHLTVPGILSKTMHALEVLRGDYDVFFRTNLSSMVMTSTLDHFVQSQPSLCYSGGFAWPDALRENLLATGRIGPDRSLASLAELDAYPGNTFVSGSGFFLNADEAAHLVRHRADLRWGLPDDVAIGLMLDRHVVIEGFSELVRPETPIAEMVRRIERTSAAHIRLQHFPVERARALWRYLSGSDAWR